MFTYLLFPTDFSDVSEFAFGYVKKLREAGAKKALILHVIDTREINFIAGMETFLALNVKDVEKEVRDELKVKAEHRLREMKAELEALGFEAQYEIVEGIPHEKILERAQKENVSLIVLGSHGRSLFKEIILGSTSEKVVRKSLCPVLVVRPPEQNEENN